MKKSRHGVRRRSRSLAFRLIASLIALLLPLQGITGAMAAIEAPAHYHSPSPTGGSTSSPDTSLDAAVDAPEQLTHPLREFGPRTSTPAPHAHATILDQASIAEAGAHAHGAHSHRAGSHVHEAPSELNDADGVEELSGALAPLNDASPKIDPAPLKSSSRSDARIGHHAHALADPGVVYVKGVPDQPESGASGVQAAAADAALTSWWMPLRGDIGAQSLPHATWRYQSHAGLPALRPPAVVDALTA